MKHKFKILLSIIFILSISLTVSAKPNYSYSMDPIQTPSVYQGTYVNEEITTPISQVGIPEQYTQPQLEEQWLEIVWNKWHAKVRNKFTSDISASNTPDNYILATICKIDLNKNISNIMIIYFPEKSLNIVSGTAYVKKGEDFYLYNHNSDKFFIMNIDKNVSCTIGAEHKNEKEEIQKILATAKYREEIFYKIPYFTFFETSASKIQKRQGQSFLKFPEGSKRASVVVACALTDLDTVATVTEYTAGMFNDIER